MTWWVAPVCSQMLIFTSTSDLPTWSVHHRTTGESISITWQRRVYPRGGITQDSGAVQPDANCVFCYTIDHMAARRKHTRSLDHPKGQLSRCAGYERFSQTIATALVTCKKEKLFGPWMPSWAARLPAPAKRTCSPKDGWVITILSYVLIYLFSNRWCICHITQSLALTLSCGSSLWVWFPHALDVVCYLSWAAAGFLSEIMFTLRWLGTTL